MPQKIYPRSKDKETVYLKSVISNPNIIIGDYTMYKYVFRRCALCRLRRKAVLLHKQEL